MHWGCHIFGGVKLHLFQNKQWRTNPNVRRKPSSWQAGGAVFIWGHTVFFLQNSSILRSAKSPLVIVFRESCLPGGFGWIWNDDWIHLLPRWTNNHMLQVRLIAALAQSQIFSWVCAWLCRCSWLMAVEDLGTWQVTSRLTQRVSEHSWLDTLHTAGRVWGALGQVPYHCFVKPKHGPGVEPGVWGQPTRYARWMTRRRCANVLLGLPLLTAVSAHLFSECLPSQSSRLPMRAGEALSNLRI